MNLKPLLGVMVLVGIAALVAPMSADATLVQRCIFVEETGWAH